MESLSVAPKQKQENGSPDLNIASLFDKKTIEEQGPSESRWDNITARSQQLQKYKILEEHSANLLETVTTLIPDLKKVSLNIQDEEVSSIISSYLDSKIPDYIKVNPDDHLAKERQQLIDLSEVLSNCGLINNDVACLYREKLSSVGGELLVELKNGLVYEVAQTLYSEAYNAGNTIPVSLVNILRDSRDNLHKVVSVLAADQFTIKSDEGDLLVSNTTPPGQSRQAVFRFKDQSILPPKAALVLYDQCLRKIYYPETGTLDKSGFEQLLQIGQLEKLSDWKFRNSALIVEKASPNLTLNNVECDNVTVKIHGTVNLENVRIKNSRILFKGSRKSSLKGVEIDNDSTLQGNLSNSVIDASSVIQAKATKLNLRGVDWQTSDQTESLAERVKGMLVSSSQIDHDFLEKVKVYRKLGKEETERIHKESNRKFNQDDLKNSLRSAGLTVKRIKKNTVPKEYVFKETPIREVSQIQRVFRPTKDGQKQSLVAIPIQPAKDDIHGEKIQYHPVSIFTWASKESPVITKKTTPVGCCSIAEALLTIIDDCDFTKVSPPEMAVERKLGPVKKVEAQRISSPPALPSLPIGPVREEDELPVPQSSLPEPTKKEKEPKLPISSPNVPSKEDEEVPVPHDISLGLTRERPVAPGFPWGE